MWLSNRRLLLMHSKLLCYKEYINIFSLNGEQHCTGVTQPSSSSLAFCPGHQFGPRKVSGRVRHGTLSNTACKHTRALRLPHQNSNQYWGYTAMSLTDKLRQRSLSQHAVSVSLTKRGRSREGRWGSAQDSCLCFP